MRNTFIVLTLFISFIGFGQVNQAEVDSLVQIVELEKRDTNEAKILFELTYKYRRQDFEKAKEFGEEAIHLSDSLGWKKGLAFSYERLGFVYRDHLKLEESVAFFKKSLAEYQALNYKSGVISQRNALGMTYLDLGKFDESIEQYESGLELVRELGNINTEAMILLNLGIVYTRQSNYVEAIEVYEQSLDILNTLNKPNLMAHALINIGGLHSKIKDRKKAIEAFEQSLTISDSMDNQQNIAYSSQNLGFQYNLDGKYEKALEFTNRALALYKKLKHHEMIPNSIHQLAIIYQEQKEYEKADEKYEEVYKLFKAAENRTGLAGVGTNFSESLFRAGKYRASLKYATEALELGEDLEYLSVQKEALFIIQKNIAHLGNKEKAYDYLSRFTELNDSLFNEEKIRDVKQVEMNYAFNRKQLADSLAFENEKIILESNVTQERKGRWFFIGIAGLLGLLAFVLFRNNQHRRKTNQILSEQKEVIQLKSNQNELLLKEIHHRVKNNLQTISSLLFLQSAHIEDADVKQAVSAGQHRVESMALIHQKLYQRDNLAAIEMKDYLTNLGKSLIDTFSSNPDKIDLTVEMDELELDVDTAVPLGLIANEVITNSLKYAFPNGNSGNIQINMTKEVDEKLELFIKDNGIGNANTESGTSFGMQLINLLISQLGGKMESGMDNGYWVRLKV